MFILIIPKHIKHINPTCSVCIMLLYTVTVCVAFRVNHLVLDHQSCVLFPGKRYVSCSRRSLVACSVFLEMRPDGLSPIHIRMSAVVSRVQLMSR